MSETLFPLPEEQPRPQAELSGKPRLLRANRQQMKMHLASLDELLPDDHRARDLSNQKDVRLSRGRTVGTDLRDDGPACVFCRENFAAGVELYGGLGELDGFGLKATSHYAAPSVAFNIPRGPTVSFSPSFGLNDNSVGVIYRIKVAYEFQQISNWFRRSAR
jgi:hypothetical protein